MDLLAAPSTSGLAVALPELDGLVILQGGRGDDVLRRVARRRDDDVCKQMVDVSALLGPGLPTGPPTVHSAHRARVQGGRTAGGPTQTPARQGVPHGPEACWSRRQARSVDVAPPHTCTTAAPLPAWALMPCGAGSVSPPRAGTADPVMSCPRHQASQCVYSFSGNGTPAFSLWPGRLQVSL